MVGLPLRESPTSSDQPLLLDLRVPTPLGTGREEPQSAGRAGGYVAIAEDHVPLDDLAASTLIHGDARRALRLLPEECVQTVVTSPPYWSLRDYEVAAQLGCDQSLGAYVAGIVGAFAELRRVLHPSGTVWLNVGDAYTSGNRRYRAPDRKNRARAMATRPATPEGLKPKDLIGLPWRLAFALQEAGWWLRSEVVWHKPNAHPESVRDRPTKAHETVFLLSRSKDYFYDVEAVQGPNRRRLRTVWDIPTDPRQRLNGAAGYHPAVMPAALAARCVRITSAPNDFVLDPYAGSGTTLLAAERLGRRWVGIELKEEYVRLMQRRLGPCWLWTSSSGASIRFRRQRSGSSPASWSRCPRLHRLAWIIGPRGCRRHGSSTLAWRCRFITARRRSRSPKGLRGSLPQRL